jgi:hypothetical protein
MEKSYSGIHTDFAVPTRYAGVGLAQAHPNNYTTFQTYFQKAGND